MGATSTADIIRKHMAPDQEDRTCQVCGAVFVARVLSRVNRCPACIQAEQARFDRLLGIEKKTEPPDLSQAAPPSISGISLSQMAGQSQQEINHRAENGEPDQVKPPRLPSLPFPHGDRALHDAASLSLGSTATYPTPPIGKDVVLAAFRLLVPMHKLYLQDFKSDHPVLKHGSSGWPHRSAFCHCNAIPGRTGVELRRGIKDPQDVALGGVQHCGDIWKCPVCGLYSALRWQGDVIAVEKALRSDGYRLLLCVLTISHDTDTTLEREKEILRFAYTSVFGQQRKSQKKRAKRLGIAGRIRAWDVLYGRNGWHAHMNVVIAVSPNTTMQNIKDIQKELDRVYRLSVAVAGGFASMDHGLKVEEYRNGKSYMVRTGLEGLTVVNRGQKFALGYELVSTDQKLQHGLSIGALRLAAVQGYDHGGIHLTPDRAGQLCLEYAATMAGERSVVSAGVIRERLKQLGKSETATDQEQTVPTPDDYTIDGVILDPDYRREIVGKNRFVPLLQAMKAGPEPLRIWLDKIGIFLEARNVSLQYNSVDSIGYGKEKDRKRAIDGARKEVERWGILNVEIDSSDLDDFL